MHKLMLPILLGLTLFGGVAAGQQLKPDAPDPIAASVPSEGPLDSRLKLLSALRKDDAAALIELIDPVNGLEGFLSRGSEETPASIAAKVAEAPVNDGEQEFLRIWRVLAAADGVAVVATELYPQWQAQVPQLLVGAQVGVAGIGAAVAESTSMSAFERSQLIELQWALTGWLSRTDFADRQKFDQLLGIARDWIVSSGKSHPLQLQLLGPEKRLQLADAAVKSIKQALSLYGLDANDVLASVRMEEINRNGELARVRTSFKLFDVPLVFEEDLAWFEGDWQDSQTVADLKVERSKPSAPFDEVFADPMVADSKPESITNTGCRAPVAD